ncbi:hypothetical protein [Maribacter forsetii]|uniref:hypothetical protein n=1 Tax=Maribacter forsetii TaxID=444515 RepID=UPI000565FAEF|nr:hypothetical protein [Maribacter forsetii]
MKIFHKHITSSILLLVFSLGLTNELSSRYSDDTAVVFDTEQQDNQDESESDIDEEILDIDIPHREKHLLIAYLSSNNFVINTKLNLAFKIIEISQPTPPPEYIG